MGFLSRKKPKPAPVDIQEEQPIGDELQQMEELVPERTDEYAFEVGSGSDRDERARPAGPVSDSGLSLSGESSESSPPAADSPVVDEQPTTVFEAVAPGVEEDEPSEEVDEAPLNAEEISDDDEPGDGRMQAIDLIAPTRLDFLKEREAAEEVPVKTAEVIAFANQKGGVAKTTTTLNLAVAFAESGYRVLCIDLDPQGNLTMSQGIDPDKVERSLYDVLVNDMPISEIIVKREIDIAVASIDLAGAEIAMSTKIGRERSLEKALKEVGGDYDFVCIDTPPSLGLLTINALTAANKVIVPVQCEYLSMRGLVQLQNTLRMIQENLNPEVRIEGILPTMLDSRTVHAKEAVEILEENFGDLVFQSRIKKAIKFAEAPVKGASVLKYDSGSSAANYYRELAKEVLANGSA
jgi:chromosome partitioning protein